MSGQTMSARGRSMLIELEGSRSHAYRDVAGFLTIGVGHMLTRDELSSGKMIVGAGWGWIRWRDGLSADQIEVLLSEKDIRESEDTVNRYVTPMLSQNQFDALVSFAFNVGSRAFQNSTLVRRINTGNREDVPAQFRRWIYAGGETHDGLVARRETEVERWNEQTA